MSIGPDKQNPNVGAPQSRQNSTTLSIVPHSPSALIWVLGTIAIVTAVVAYTNVDGIRLWNSSPVDTSPSGSSPKSPSVLGAPLDDRHDALQPTTLVESPSAKTDKATSKWLDSTPTSIIAVDATWNSRDLQSSKDAVMQTPISDAMESLTQIASETASVKPKVLPAQFEQPESFTPEPATKASSTDGETTIRAITPPLHTLEAAAGNGLANMQVAQAPPMADAGPGPALEAPQLPAPPAPPADPVTDEIVEEESESVDTPNPRVTDDTQRQILIQAARNSVALGDLEEAAERFQALIEAFPSEIEGRIEYAGILARLERTTQAIQIYRTILQLDPGNAAAIAALADLLAEQENLAEAADLLIRQLEQDPQNIKVALRLCRIYLQTNERVMAMQVFNQHIRQNVSARYDRITAGQLLVDLNDPSGAIQLLISLMETDQLGADGLKLAMRCYAITGHFESLRNLVNHHIQLNPENTQVILSLGEELLDEERSLAALHILEEAARYTEPEAKILTLLTRARIGEFQLTAAQQAIEEFCGVIPEYECTLLMGEIMLRTGNYFEALADFDQVLSFDPENLRATLGKAETLQYLGQYDVAEAMLADYGHHHPDLLSVKYRLAQLHVERRNFVMAESIYQEILTEYPGIVYTYEAYLGMLAEQHRYADALALIHQIQATRSQELLLISALRIEQAHILTKKGQAIQAMELLRNFEPASRLQLARGYFVMYQAATIAGDHAVASAAKAKLMMICSESLSISVETANDALDECMAGLAVEILDQARHMSGDQIALIVRQADAYSAMNDRASFCIAEEMYRSVLTMSPTNAAARIGLCRVLTNLGRYPEAEQCYHNLTRDMPNFVTAQRENARLVYDRRGRVHGDAAYNNLLKQAPKHLPSSTPPPKLGPMLSIDPMKFESHGLTEAIAIEQVAQSWKDWRASTAICEYEKLIAVEPSNEAAYFDLGQQYSVKKNTHAAIHSYKELLDVNPCNHPAHIALDGTVRKVVPRTNFDFLYFHQSGRDGLANVTRLGLDWGVVFPFGNEDEYVQFHYTHLIYDGPGYDAVTGNAFGGGIYDRFMGCYTYFAEMDVQVFDEGFSSRPTFNLGLGMDTACDGHVEVGGFLENVVENGESIQQDIFMGGGRLFGYMYLMPRWYGESRYRFIGYSDHNFRHDFYVHNQFRLIEAPNELNLLADYDFLSYDEGSVFGPGPGIQGTTHPYFSPSGFSNVSLGLEWKHYFSQYTFNGAPLCWASMEYRGQWDSRGEFYNIGRIKSYCDINGSLSAGAEYHIMRSAVYDSDVVYAYLQWFLP